MFCAIFRQPQYGDHVQRCHRDAFKYWARDRDRWITDRLFTDLTGLFIGIDDSRATGVTDSRILILTGFLDKKPVIISKYSKI